jgi:hypothetical protein
MDVARHSCTYGSVRCLRTYRRDGPSLPDELLRRFFVSRRFYDELARV